MIDFKRSFRNRFFYDFKFFFRWNRPTKPDQATKMKSQIF